MRIVLLVLVAALSAAPTSATPAPDHDDFTAARTVQPPFEEALDIAGATLEESEPRPACAFARDSVWYRIEPTLPTPVVVSTTGSELDTFIAVYRGSTLDGLMPIACNDDAWGRLQSQIAVVAQPGAPTMIQVGATVVWGSFGEQPSTALRVTVALGAEVQGSQTGAAGTGAMVGPSTARVGAETQTQGFGARVEPTADAGGGHVQVRTCLAAPYGGESCETRSAP